MAKSEIVELTIKMNASSSLPTESRSSCSATANSLKPTKMDAFWKTAR